MHKLLGFLFVIMMFSGAGFAASSQHTQSSQPAIHSSANWYDDFLFHDKSFAFEFIRTLGYAYAGGADLGEAVSTARNIKDGDIYSWYQQWLNTANRIQAFAYEMQTAGDFISAKEAYFRASNYYRTASFYLNAVKDREKSTLLLEKSKASFLDAIASLPHIKVISIPYENTTLPAYFIPSFVSHAPLLIVNTGFDGTAEELFFEVGIAAYKRGYNVLLFEGPGQGSVLREQHLSFRYDWEHVVSPVIDYAMTLPNFDKNKIALMGISMGGYLAARACAFDTRIKACILNGGIYDLAASVYKTLPPKLIALLKSNPNQFNHFLYENMKTNTTSAWFFNNAMWVFDAKTPADVMEKLNAYTIKNVVDKIKSPVLVIDSEEDSFFQGQPKQVFDALKAPKRYLKFTREEAAQAHCQMGATAISNEKIFNWLNNIFGITPA